MLNHNSSVAEIQISSHEEKETPKNGIVMKKSFNEKSNDVVVSFEDTEQQPHNGVESIKNFGKFYFLKR